MVKYEEVVEADQMNLKIVSLLTYWPLPEASHLWILCSSPISSKFWHNIGSCAIHKCDGYKTSYLASSFVCNDREFRAQLASRARLVGLQQPSSWLATRSVLPRLFVTWKDTGPWVTLSISSHKPMMFQIATMSQTQKHFLSVDIVLLQMWDRWTGWWFFISTRAPKTLRTPDPCPPPTAGSLLMAMNSLKVSS